MNKKLPLLLIVIEAANSFFINIEDSRVKRDLSCPTEIFSCKKPLDYEDTKQFLCTTNEKCPEGHICCDDSCFSHKICKKGKESEKSLNCPIEFHQCSTPLNYEDTKAFLCYNNKECADGYKCCEDSCFHHKICKQVDGGEEDVKSTRKILPTNITVATTTPTTTVSTTPTTTSTTTVSATSTTSTVASTITPTNATFSTTISTNKISESSIINVTASSGTLMITSSNEIESDDVGDDVSDIINKTTSTPERNFFGIRF